MDKILKIIAYGSVSIYFWVASIITLREKKVFKEEETQKRKIDFRRLNILNKYKKGEYIPIEEVITDFNWLDLQIAIKEQAPNIELCYLVRAYGSTDFKIITANELKELDNAGKLDNLFISPLFKIL
ncbi:hypothetical protein [Fusobacterium periodonticum]|uniref:hypothetical protein n=1 Tax=Fusobacterium periodonticum TaxID=860 RepID=UPI0028D66319|nr:hypothetical protein [Fusobacterium periodonticum]